MALMPQALFPRLPAIKLWRRDASVSARDVSAAVASGCKVSAFCMISGGSRRIAKTTAECSCEINVVAKATGVGDLTEWQPSLHQSPATQKTGGVIEAGRLDELAAGRASYCEEFLEIA